MTTTRRRRALAVAAAVLAAVLLALGGTLFYFQAEIADSSAFAGRLVSSLDDTSVRAVVSARIVDGLVDASSGDVLTVRPLISRTVESFVGAPVFRRTATLAGEEAHRALVHGDSRVVLVVRRNAAVVLDALRSVSPAVAARIPPGVQQRIADAEAGDTQLVVGRRLLDLTDLRWLVIAAAVLCLVAAGLAAREPRRALVYVGGSVAGAGVLVASAVTIGGVLAGRSWADTATERSAVAAVWGALFGDLRTAGLIVLAGGLVVIALSVLVPDRGRTATVRLRAVPAAAVLSVALFAVVAAAIGAVLAAGDVPEPAHAGARAPARGCNGSIHLCERRIDDVIFPSTHNSYAAADEPGWFFANQRFGIARQLKDGIRGLLIDVHHGVFDPNVKRVRTDLRADGSDRNKVARALSPAALRMADRLAGRVGAGELVGTPGLYLCHGLCELGAEPLDQELAVIRSFLKAEPDQVLVVIVEDYIPPAQIESAFSKNGLLPYVAEFDRSKPLPTLGELVATGKRLVVLAEEKGGTPAWYMPAFSFVQDTPYQAARPDQLSCRRYRGDADSPLLLLNHWIARFPPRPSDQLPIAGTFLTDRVGRCTRERGIVGALVAVDFYERSGVIQAAREFNDRSP